MTACGRLDWLFDGVIAENKEGGEVVTSSLELASKVQHSSRNVWVIKQLKWKNKIKERK
jgi:hypothetical protein